MTEKGTTFQWIFTLKSKHKQLKNVCLLSETGVQQQFKIDVIEEKELNEEHLLQMKESYSTKSSADWVHPEPRSKIDTNSNFEYEIFITFEASIYGTFRYVHYPDKYLYLSHPNSQGRTLLLIKRGHFFLCS